MPNITVDKSLLIRRTSRSRDTYDNNAVVQREMAAHLVEKLLLKAGTAEFPDVLELGCGTGLLTRQLLEKCRIRQLTLNDISPTFESTSRMAKDRQPGLEISFMPGDMESLTFPDRQDLIISNAVFQWAVDPRALLSRLTGLLKDNGILAMSSFGPANMHEVAQGTGLSLPYMSMHNIKAAMANSYEILGESEYVWTLWFSSAREVLRHLQQMGVNALDSGPWSRARILSFCRDYESAFGQDGQVCLTYHPLSIIARKK
jgi:malonyl-CoA O-methyltransferase